MINVKGFPPGDALGISRKPPILTFAQRGLHEGYSADITPNHHLIRSQMTSKFSILSDAHHLIVRFLPDTEATRFDAIWESVGSSITAVDFYPGDEIPQLRLACLTCAAAEGEKCARGDAGALHPVAEYVASALEGEFILGSEGKVLVSNEHDKCFWSEN